jgi:hypothetical protein
MARYGRGSRGSSGTKGGKPGAHNKGLQRVNPDAGGEFHEAGGTVSGMSKLSALWNRFFGGGDNNLAMSMEEEQEDIDPIHHHITHQSSTGAVFQSTFSAGNTRRRGASGEVTVVHREPGSKRGLHPDDE